MTINKKELYGLIIILVLVLFLPLAIFFLKGRFDIRPRAQLAGQVNFKLNADTTNILPGQRTNVLIFAELTDPNVRVSGVDFLLLYDSNKLKLVTLSPVLGNSFSEAVVVDTSGSPYTGEGTAYSFMRLSMVARKPTADLPGGTISLANVTFEARQSGSAVIKFPEDNTRLQVVGTTL